MEDEDVDKRFVRELVELSVVHTVTEEEFSARDVEMVLIGNADVDDCTIVAAVVVSGCDTETELVIVSGVMEASDLLERVEGF